MRRKIYSIENMRKLLGVSREMIKKYLKKRGYNFHADVEDGDGHVYFSERRALEYSKLHKQYKLLKNNRIRLIFRPSGRKQEKPASPNAPGAPNDEQPIG